MSTLQVCARGFGFVYPCRADCLLSIAAITMHRQETGNLNASVVHVFVQVEKEYGGRLHHHACEKQMRNSLPIGFLGAAKRKQEFHYLGGVEIFSCTRHRHSALF